MRFVSILSEAMHSLEANWLRSSLAVLGIVIGVASVIIMIGVGQGGQSEVKRAIESLGSNLLIISPLKDPNSNRTFNEDVARFAEELPEVDVAAPVTEQVPINAAYGETSSMAFVLGTVPEFFQVRGWKPQDGMLLTDADIRANPRIAVIGQTIRQALFPDGQAVGKLIRIADVPFTVTGVLRKKGHAMDGSDQDAIIAIPLDIARRRVLGQAERGGIKMVLVKIRSGNALPMAAQGIEEHLRKAYKMNPDEKDFFRIRDLSEIAHSALKTGRTMTVLLASIASISLIVGGIGIMNIMYVCVNERTREIGIRKSIGASKMNILLQFLLEAVLLALCGCVLGVAAGLLGIWAARSFFGVAAAFNATGMAAAVASAAGIGLLFGYYPARKAANLLPVEALRH